jgi:MFS family permease
MTTTTHLLRARRFLPLFVTQLLGAFNDNLFKNAMVLFVVFSVYNSEKAEAHFSGMATALFIIPFVALSALSGQLADMRDKARIIRIVKTCEIGIMAVGATGLLLAWKGFHVEGLAIPLMLLALFAMGVHSTFFGPIKYAILPQHLHADEVLAGTGLVEAGTYLAILLGTIVAGYISAPAAAITVIVTALIGFFAGRRVPDAPPEKPDEPSPCRCCARSWRVRATRCARSGWCRWWWPIRSSRSIAWSIPPRATRACSWRFRRSASSGRWAPSCSCSSRRSPRTCWGAARKWPACSW